MSFYESGTRDAGQNRVDRVCDSVTVRAASADRFLGLARLSVRRLDQLTVAPAKSPCWLQGKANAAWWPRSDRVIVEYSAAAEANETFWQFLRESVRLAGWAADADL